MISSEASSEEYGNDYFWVVEKYCPSDVPTMVKVRVLELPMSTISVQFHPTASLKV
uniref:Uncharacterized protein n=1 Tax=Arundo donax TaxID=35708 RepID=A0A0A8ZUD6_ARUDO